MIRKIESKKNNRIKYASSLLLNKYRKENNQFLAEGSKSLQLAIKAGVVSEIFTTKELNIDDKIPQNIVSSEILKKISSTQNPEGIVFICNQNNKAISKKAKRLIYLDEISDPGNLGTIIRTALAFDYDGVVLSEGCCSPYNEKTVAATKGAIFLIPVVYGKLSDIKEDKKIIVSTLSSDSKNIDEIASPDSLILVLGNESRGVSKESLNVADIKVKIPIKNIDSLNVSVASGILMNHFKK